VLDDVSLLKDPCPLPDKEKKRSLNEKERMVYAPMSGVGGIVYDKVCAVHVLKIMIIWIMK
jgi:ribosome biogenesis protein BMS1